MQIEEAIFLGQQALLTVAYVSGPILVIAMVVGVVVALFKCSQAQEMTIVFVPKIIAVFFMMALLGGWMLENLLHMERCVLQVLKMLRTKI